MSEQMTIEVERRAETGKNANRRLRTEGQIPAVVYGGGKESVPIQIPRRKLLDLIRTGGGEHAVFLLKLAGTDSQRHTMIRDLQIHSVTRQILHIDFQRVLMTEAVKVEIPIELEGIPLGVKNEGGMMEFITREVEVECLPGDIPHHLSLSVADLHIGQHLEAKDIEMPEKVTLHSEPTQVIVSVVQPRIVTEAEEAEEEGLLEAEAEEPEVIGRHKEAEETEED